MHSQTSRPRRRPRCIAAAFAIAVAVAVVPATASAVVFTYSVKLSEKTQTATGIPGDPGGKGRSYISMDNLTNQVCATTEWSGIDDPVGFGHVHAGGYGQVENPGTTIDLFPAGTNVQSPAQGCTTAAPGEIDRIAGCPPKWNAVIHSAGYPVAAIRGQLSGACPNPPPL
jgi:hypothetical protein